MNTFSQNTPLLSGKVAVVTGAGAGLGREYAKYLANLGASVVVNDVGHAVDGTGNSIDPAQLVVEEIVSSGGHAIANSSSVADWHGAQSIIDSAISTFGRLDIVVNNAGINRPSSLVELSEADIDLELSIHLKGTLAVSHFAAAHWAHTGPVEHRAIVNTTSAAGLHPMAGGGVYGAAKAGVAALTLSHAQELAKYGVRVNAVAPCARTRLVLNSPNVAALMPESNEHDRHLPEHVSPLVAYLASPLCRFTGRVFAIEGPDVAIYGATSVIGEWSTQHQWTVQQLADALSAEPNQIAVRGFFPGGPADLRVPTGRTLKLLVN
jgi:NAD(P)-dependent dehydrogenase (short-subunit alcohol dehydrogenase family)